jgi:hypothetical protein
MESGSPICLFYDSKEFTMITNTWNFKVNSSAPVQCPPSSLPYRDIQTARFHQKHLTWRKHQHWMWCQHQWSHHTASRDCAWWHRLGCSASWGRYCGWSWGGPGCQWLRWGGFECCLWSPLYVWHLAYHILHCLLSITLLLILFDFSHMFVCNSHSITYEQCRHVFTI